jgi:2-oxoacid:acceptor oxidoreductase delta subunit (pyruvate/2-ketoisovalerate family)
MNIALSAQPGTTMNNKTGSWRTFRPKTGLDKCIGCATCVRVCPDGIIAMAKLAAYEKEKPATDYDYCKGCGVCAAECPVKCIEMELEEK